MMKLPAVALFVALAMHAQTPDRFGPASIPATATMPTACLEAVKQSVAKAQKEAQAAPPSAALSQQISGMRVSLATTCTQRFGLATTPATELPSAIELYTMAGQLDAAKNAIARAMPLLKTLPQSSRAAVLLQSFQLGMREPKSDERNARLEKIVDELDTLSAADAFTQQWSAHSSLEGYYRADDIDAGIIKHAQWIIKTAKTFTPEQRASMGLQVVRAHVNMAEALAGQNQTVTAIAQLTTAKREWADLPRAADYIDPEVERLSLVGTDAAAITAPSWLNKPSATPLDLKGKVTLLEFTAHWCGPCRESYPGVNRLRARYGAQGFQVVMATQLYGYFQTERNLDADAEIARDKTYFAEHDLDLPIAIGPRVMVKVVDGKVEYSPAKDPNDEHYKVGGIPQIHLIDKQGRIRLVMVGYDDANEPKLEKMIQDLLKGK